MTGPSVESPQGRLLVISAPSGGGKSTIVRALRRTYPGLQFSVSATTRARRPSETNGKEYFFLAKEEFRSRIERGDLIEWEEIYGDYYGTLRSEVDRALAAGQVMLFDVDVKGGLSIKRIYGERALLIFLRPPSLEVLAARLRGRKTESPDALERRLARVPMELEQGKAFDVQVVNDDLQRAIAEVVAIVRERTGLKPSTVQHAQGGKTQ